MHPFDVLVDPVRRRLLELLAEGERSVRRSDRGGALRVRGHTIGSVAAPEGAA